MNFNQPGILSIDGELLAVRPLVLQSTMGEPTRIELEVIPNIFDRSNTMARLNGRPAIKRVIFNDPATIVIWSDDSKTVVKCQENDEYSEEIGLAMCIAKKYFGNQGNYNEVFKKWIPVDPVDDTSVEKMRGELYNFCYGKGCSRCVLKSPVCRCGNGTHFNSKNRDGSYNMTDDEIRKAYAIVFRK